MGNSVTLTVESKNGKAVDSSYSQVFVVDNMTDIIANPNLAVTQTVTAADDTASQTSLWDIQFGTNVPQQTVYYWGVTYVGTTVTLWVWADSTHNFLVAKGSATISGATGRVVANPQNSSGITVSMLETMANKANDLDAANTLTLNYVTPDTSQIEVPGATQFAYTEGDGLKNTYCVTESTSDIQVAISGEASVLTASVNLTSAQILALHSTPIAIVSAPGAGYILELVSGFVELDATGTGYANNRNLTIVTGTTHTVQATAATAVAGTSDKITRFVETAGVVQANEGFDVGISGAEATGTGTAKVVITYKITAI